MIYCLKNVALKNNRLFIFIDFPLKKKDNVLNIALERTKKMHDNMLIQVNIAIRCSQKCHFLRKLRAVWTFYNNNSGT